MNKIAKKKFEILDYTQSDEFNIDELAEKLNELTGLITTDRTCYNCKFCMYESNEPKHKQFTCIGTIDLKHITDPHQRICKLWDE